jgi:hypothetical protein
MHAGTFQQLAREAAGLVKAGFLRRR